MKPSVFVLFALLVSFVVVVSASARQHKPAGRHFSDRTLTADRHRRQGSGQVDQAAIAKQLADDQPDVFADIVKANIDKVGDKLDMKTILENQKVREKIDAAAIKAVLNDPKVQSKIDGDMIVNVVTNPDVTKKIDFLTLLQNDKVLEKIDFEKLLNDDKVLEKIKKSLEKVCLQALLPNEALVILGTTKVTNTTNSECVPLDFSEESVRKLLKLVLLLPAKYVKQYSPYVLFGIVGFYWFIAIISIVSMFVCCWPRGGAKNAKPAKPSDDAKESPKDSRASESKSSKDRKGSKKRKD